MNPALHRPFLQSKRPGPDASANAVADHVPTAWLICRGGKKLAGYFQLRLAHAGQTHFTTPIAFNAPAMADDEAHAADGTNKDSSGANGAGASSIISPLGMHFKQKATQKVKACVAGMAPCLVTDTQLWNSIWSLDTITSAPSQP